MQRQTFSQDEHMAASAVADLASGKHEREQCQDVEMRDCKRTRMDEQQPGTPGKPAKKHHAHVPRALRPAPFFFYKDFSEEPDPDPLKPLTAPGRVPNFPAKMHAILSRKELREIVAWQPHGRSWRVLKPREFEIKVLPKFFEHAKFSSFVRQANGWGFRRINQGPDRNSYYHEKFLRGLPHLSKGMKRPGVAEKKTSDPEHEPDLYAISQFYPLPDKIEEDESILLQCTLQGGPRARVPIYSGAMAMGSSLTASALPPRDPFVLDSHSFQQSIAASENSVRLHQKPAATPSHSAGSNLPLPSFLSPHSRSTLSMGGHHQTSSTLSALAAANQLSLQAAPPATATSPSMAAAVEAAAASQFAAGFAAATAFSQHQFRNILDNLSQQQQQNNSSHQSNPNQPQQQPNSRNGFQNQNNNGFPPCGGYR